MREQADSCALELGMLDHVTGGLRPARQSPELLQILNNTNTSIKDMVRAQQASYDQMPMMMMAMMMMRAR